MIFTKRSQNESNDELLNRLMVKVNDQAFRQFGSKVRAGPFEGMIIPERTHWDDGNASTKLLGCYEFELHPALDYAIWRKPQVVINIGCAEGYYAVGMARLGQFVYAADISTESLSLCSKYAELNGVADRIILAEGCRTPDEMILPKLRGHRLYIMDCEGDEMELVDLARCPPLAESDLIIECHDFMHYGTSTQIADRLSKTHRVELIRPDLPDLQQFPFLKVIPTVMTLLMVVEKRPMPCYWLACWANQKVS